MKYYLLGALLIASALLFVWAVTNDDQPSTPKPSTTVPTAPSNNAIRNLQIN